MDLIQDLENNLGKDLRECLGELCQRNPQNFDMKIFVSSVLLQRDTGGNLIEIIENISGTIRDRFVFGNKVKALTSEAKFSAFILMALPFCVGGLIALMRPEYLVLIDRTSWHPSCRLHLFPDGRQCS